MAELQPGYELVEQIDAVAAHAYLARSYWSPGIPLATVERAIANSLCIAVRFEGRQVAFARVATGLAWTGLGALAVGASAAGAMAIGALAIGAAAIGSLAVGRLVMGRAEVRDLRIARLEVGEFVVTRSQEGSPANVPPGAAGS